MTWSFDNFADNTAVITEAGERYTYAELAAYGDSLYSKIGRRCLVFILCRNEIGSVTAYTSCINHRVVPLLIDSGLDKELLCGLIENYRPDYIICPDDMAEGFAGSEQYKYLGYTLVKTEYENEYPLYDELALLLTTSGSTGSPKLVRQSYKNIRANTDSIVEYLALDETERAITTLPMSYTYGLSIINTHLTVGASLILTSKTLMQREFWAAFKQYEATSFGGVPYTYEMLNKLRFFRMTLPSLRYMTQAGGKLSPELHRQFAEYALNTGRRFIVMYGQTEATARMSWLPAERSLEKYGSMGVAIPGGRFSLIDAEGKEIKEPDTVGELVYEGDNVTLGYATCGDDLIKPDERHGRLVTGDMAKRDAEGFYFIVGRKKRFLKLFGKRVNLDECEQLVKAKYPGAVCACAGVDDKLYVFATDEAVYSEVQSFLAEKLNINHAGIAAVLLNEMPVKDSGKTNYQALEAYYKK